MCRGSLQTKKQVVEVKRSRGVSGAALRGHTLRLSGKQSSTSQDKHQVLEFSQQEDAEVKVSRVHLALAARVLLDSTRIQWVRLGWVSINESVCLSACLCVCVTSITVF